MSGHLQELRIFVCSFTKSHQTHRNLGFFPCVLFLQPFLCTIHIFSLNLGSCFGRFPFLLSSFPYLHLERCFRTPRVKGHWIVLLPSSSPFTCQWRYVAVFPVRLAFCSDAFNFSLTLRLGRFTGGTVGLCVTNITYIPPFPRLRGADMKGSA